MSKEQSLSYVFPLLGMTVRLAEKKGEAGALGIAADKVEAAVVGKHDLTGKAEADA